MDNNKINYIIGFYKKLLKNKLLLAGIIVMVGLLVVTVIFRNNIFKKNVVLGDSKTVVKDIKVDSNINELTVVASRIENLDKASSIFIKVKNNTNQEISESNLKLNIYDKDNNLLLVSIINKVNKFNIGDEREFQVSTANDISNAFKYVVEKVS